MLEKVSAFWRVFRAGEKVANPAAWKAGQMAANDVAALFAAGVALAAAFGVRIDLTPEEMAAIGGGIVAVFGVVNRMLTTATTDKIGALYDRSAAADGPGNRSENGDRVPTGASLGALAVPVAGLYAADPDRYRRDPAIVPNESVDSVSADRLVTRADVVRSMADDSNAG